MDFKSSEEAQKQLEAQRYLADDGLSTAIFLAVRLKMPLFLEGEAGVGKTEVGKALAQCGGSELIRLQCYEGIGIHQAVYEWDYSRQLLHLRVLEATKQILSSPSSGESEEPKSSDTSNPADTNNQAANQRSVTAEETENELYSRKFLVERPLLKALSYSGEVPPLLLIDEIDRADDEFEAFLLEMLSDWSITIPEFGTVKAKVPPTVVITSNRTRDVHDALKRRCLYHWVSHPNLEREVDIILLRAGNAVTESLARQVAEAVSKFREMDLYKPPGVAESIVWAMAMGQMGAKELTPDLAKSTLGTILKYVEDQEKVVEVVYS